MNHGAGAPTSERRVVAVLFADVAGYTAMAEHLDPEVVTDVMNEIFAALGAEVEAVGGHVDKVIGDSLMALFGAPVAHEDDALRAVRAALGMQRAMAARAGALAQRVGQVPRLRIGIHSGQVVWGAVGPSGRAQPTVMGDVVNLAARLQRAAPEGGVLISDAVHRQVRGACECLAREPIVVKGKTEPVVVYEVLGERERMESASRPPFVNRRDDLAQLDELLTRAGRGRAQVAVIIGDPGVGKTRLVEEFTDRLPGDMALLRTACPPYGGQSLAPLADLFRQFAGLVGPVTLADVEARVPLGERAAHAAAVLSRLFNLTEVPAERLGVEVSRDAALLVAAEAIRRMLVRTTVVWIEDLQWADAGTRELLPIFVERLAETPLLLIGTVRAGETVPVWGKRTAVATIQLDPLADDDARTLLAALVGAPLAEPAADTILAKARGNPFYLSEMVATLRGAGTLVLDDDGRPRLTGSVNDVLPDTVQAAVLARLDRLPPETRAIVQRAAVIGSRFSRAILAALDADPSLDEGLAHLEEAYIIRRDDPLAADPDYSFVHPLVREVAYASLLLKHQTALHAQVAEALERIYPERSEALAKDIGTHYERGGRPRQAAARLLEAGRQALRRYALQEVIELLERARALAGEDQVDILVEVNELLADVYPRVHGHGPEKRHKAWSYVLTHLDASADPVRAARAAIGLGAVAAGGSGGPTAQSLFDRAAAWLPPDHALWSELHVAWSQVLVANSQYREAVDAAREAVRIADRVGTMADRARAYASLAHPALLPLLGADGHRIMQRWLAEVEATGDERLLIDANYSFTSEVWTRGVVDETILRHVEDAARNAQQYGWTADEAEFRTLLGWATFLIGQWSRAETALEQAREIVETHGGRILHRFLMILPYARGNLAMGRGRLPEAAQVFEDGLRRVGFHAPIWLNHDLARCQLMMGDNAAARSTMARALEATDRIGCVICGCQATGVAGEFYAMVGEMDRAAALAQEAEATALEIGHVPTRVRAARTRARIALRHGQPDVAQAAAREAMRFGDELPMPHPLERAQTLWVLGEAQAGAGQRAEGLAAWRHARELLAALGADWHLAQLETVLTRAGDPS